MHRSKMVRPRRRETKVHFRRGRWWEGRTVQKGT